jgi:hypothetical protein
MLTEQDAAQLGEPGRAVVEYAEDPLAVIDREVDHDPVGVDGAEELARGRLIDASSEVTNELGADGHAGKNRHARNRTSAEVRREA